MNLFVRSLLKPGERKEEFIALVLTEFQPAIYQGIP